MPCRWRLTLMHFIARGEITDRWTNGLYDDGTGKTVAQRMELIRTDWKRYAAMGNRPV